MKKFLRLGIIIYFVYSLTFNFSELKAEVLTTMKIWANTIVPSVFPYMIISVYIADYFSGKKKVGFPGKLICKILGISPQSLGSIVSSFLCGYPSGAMCASELYKNNIISNYEAERLILFTNNAGPLFLISAVGTVLMQNTRDGVAIYIIQLISAFLFALILPHKKIYHKANKHSIIKVKNSPQLCDVISNSVSLSVNICGFMIISAIASGSVIELINKYIGNFLYLNTFIKGFFEITSGVREAVLMPGESLSFSFICAIVSWSGLSVIWQIMSVSPSDLKLSRLIYAKFTQSTFSFILGFIYKSHFREQYSFIFKSSLYQLSLIASLIFFVIYLLLKKRVRNTRTQKG